MAESNFGNSTSERIEELIAGYALDALSAEEADQLQHYLLDNPELQEKLSTYQEIVSLIACAPPRVAPPERLRSQIMAAVAPPLPQAKPFLTWRKVAIAALTLLSLGVLLDNYFLRRELVTAQNKLNSLKAEDNYLFVLKGTETAPKARGKIFIDEPSQKIATALQNLPPLPAGKSYFLWAVSRDENIRCGRIQASSDRVVEAIAIPPIEYDKPDTRLILTIESDSNPTNPSRDIVMVGTSI